MRMKGVREVDLEELFRQWGSPMTNVQLSKHLGITGGTLSYLGKKHGLPQRPRVTTRDTQRRPADPTQEEIEERAAECREMRTKEEKERLERAGRVDYSLPSYAFSRTDYAFKEIAS